MLSLYPRLAAVNIRNHKKTYLPYILTCIGTVMMFYILRTLQDSEHIQGFTGGDILQVMLGLGSWVVAVFAVIFLFYTSSFLIKQRKKEFGLFNILGMEKRHIAWILCFETLCVAVVSLVLGILGGFLLSKLVELLLFRILLYPVVFGFHISARAIGSTLGLFGGIFLLTLLGTIRQIHLAKPVELLSGGQVGEREPRVRWLIVLLGLVCTGAGYYIAIVTESPLEALLYFFVAVILVIVGTYCLFTAVSVAVLKLLKRNKGFYYKPNHFIPVSGMVYRMRQNAVGLSNICILSTMVLVMISGTVALYAGVEDMLEHRSPYHESIHGYAVTQGQHQALEALLLEMADERQMPYNDLVSYRYDMLIARRQGEGFIRNDSSMSDMTIFSVITQGDYNTATGNNVALGDGEILVQPLKGELPGDTLLLGDTAFRIVGYTEDNPAAQTEDLTVTGFFALVVADWTVMDQMEAALYPDYMPTEDTRYCHIGVNFTAGDEEQLALHWALVSALVEMEFDGYAANHIEDREEAYAVYGGFLFLGLFLGLLFIMATVLIIYYKQISEGYEDRARFAIMQQVGMSRGEIRGAIRSQVLMVFFLPLVVACCHIAAAFRMITRMLSVLYLTNVGLFALTTLVTVAVFAVFYAVVYAVTAREYYKIVR